MPDTEMEETKAFLAELEQRRGGKITYRAFSAFYGDNRGILREFGVFFYEVDKTFWFQDFERENTFLGFKIGAKKAEKYVMFESSFSPLDVVGIRKVLKSRARKCVQDAKPFDKLKTYNPVLFALSEYVTEITLKDGRIMFFQFIDSTVEKKIKQYQMDNQDTKGD